jgi:hypothetical protein
LSSRFGPAPVQAPFTVTTSFHDLLTAAALGARQLDGEGVLSLALPLPGRDPMALLNHLGEGERFRFLWDSAPGLCLAASGRTNSLELSGPRRFELAQRFSAVSLNRLAAPQACPPLARPRVLLAFAFFDSPLQEGEGMAGVHAVLPRWQLSRQGRHCWLRLQRSLGGDSTPRALAEELWEQAQQLMRLPADPCAGWGAMPGPAIVTLPLFVLHCGQSGGMGCPLAPGPAGRIQPLVPLAVRRPPWFCPKRIGSNSPASSRWRWSGCADGTGGWRRRFTAPADGASTPRPISSSGSMAAVGRSSAQRTSAEQA